jgi:hypothetical protein
MSDDPRILEESVRCPGCGRKIFLTPCQICLVLGQEIWYNMGLTTEKAAERPTSALPGTHHKLRVLLERAEKGQPLWHPMDARWPEGSPCNMMTDMKSGDNQDGSLQ